MNALRTSASVFTAPRSFDHCSIANGEARKDALRVMLGFTSLGVKVTLHVGIDHDVSSV